MERVAVGDTIVLANISTAKCLAGGCLALLIAIVPNLPGFGERLTYTAFLYTTATGIALRLIGSGFMFLIAMSLLYCATLTIIGSPKGVWFVDGEIRWGRIGTKRLVASTMKATSYHAKRRGILIERRDDVKTAFIPINALRSDDAPEPLLAKLRELILQT